MKKRFLSLLTLCCMVSAGIIPVAHATENVKTQSVIFSQNSVANRSQTISIPNLIGVQSVTIDNGSVTYSVSGENITINVSNGVAQSVQTSGSYTPADTIYVTNQTTANYNQNGYSGTLTQYVASGTYTPADTVQKSDSRTSSTNSFPSSIAYNSGGYSGTLYSNGNSFVISGTPAGSKSISNYGSTSQGKNEYYIYNSTSKSWSYSSSTAVAPMITQTYNYSDSEGYTGPLSPVYTSRSADTLYTLPSNPTNGQTAVYRSYVNYYTYSGTVSKPDTQVWQQNYSGSVTKPAVDTRVYRYQGNVTKPAVDTRQYTNYYSYNVQITYKNWTNNSNPIQMGGQTFDGTSQYYLIPKQGQYNTNQITWGMFINPTSFTDQTLLSNKAMSMAIKANRLVGSITIDNVGYSLNFGADNLFLNQWNFIALSYDGTTIKFYLNNQLVGQQQATGQYNMGGSTDLTIGADTSADGSKQSFFLGKVGKVQIWNKALSSSEISLASSGTLTDTSNLVGAWQFDSLATGNVYDQTSYGNSAIGFGFASPLNGTADQISDIGATLHWNMLNNASTYVLMKGNQVVYSGVDQQFIENTLVSDTTYSYNVVAKNTNGESVPYQISFTTQLGSLEILTVPSNISFTPITLNGSNQTSYGMLNNKIIVKDTRKVRDGWRVVATSTPLTNGTHTMPINSVKLKAASNVVQTSGSYQTQAKLIATQTQSIDTGGSTLVSAGSDTGQGYYEITLPSNALELTILPETYIGNYSTNITWSLLPGAN